MFIANGTHQNIDFQYRLPEYKTYRMQNIPIGGQIQLSGELSEKQIDIIIQFHSRYGMIKYNELADFRSFHIPYVYSTEHPVPAEIISELIIHNRDYNKLLGERLRAEAAIAVNAMIEDNANAELTSFRMDIEDRQTKDRETVIITRDKERGAPQDPSPKGPLGIITDFIRPKKKANFQ
jgi:hypothetical protein